MDKKAYICKVLETIRNDRAPAEGLLILVNQGNLSEEVIDALIQMLQGAIQTTTDEITKEKLIKAQSVFEHLKTAEAEQKTLDESDIADLEAQIAAI